MATAILTQLRLKEVLHYNPDTGIFTWVNPTSPKMKKGDVAGCVNSKGYVYICIDYKNYRAHRLAWLYMKGYFPEHEIDHKDTNKTNNVFTNLREATTGQNSRNKKLQSNNQSGTKGVYWESSRQMWAAAVYHNKKRILIGRFHSFEEAVTQANLKRMELHGEFFNIG